MKPIDIDELASRMLGPVPGRDPSERHVILFFFGNAGSHGHRPDLQRVTERVIELVSGFFARTPNTPNFARHGCPGDLGSGLFAGTSDMDEVMKRVTLVVAVENLLSGFATRDGTALEGKQVIHIGETTAVLPSDAPGDRVDGDALLIMTELEHALGRQLAQSGASLPAFRSHPRSVLHVLNEELPARVMLFVDISAAGMAYAGQVIRLGTNQYYELDVEQNGCMGQAFGESIGARYRAPRDVGVACLIGDGTFCMVPSGTLHRLSISGLGGGFALTILENGGFDFVRQGVENGGIAVDGLERPSDVKALQEAKRHVEARTLGVYDQSNKPDFVAAGALWRCDAHYCSTLAVYRRRLKEAFAGTRPVILEVPIDTAYRAPIGDRSASIARLFGNTGSNDARPQRSHP